MRVKEHYYDNLKRITDKFGGTELIRLKQAAEYLGVDERRLKESRDFPMKKIGGRYYVASVALARWIS